MLTRTSFLFLFSGQFYDDMDSPQIQHIPKTKASVSARKTYEGVSYQGIGSMDDDDDDFDSENELRI